MQRALGTVTSLGSSLFLMGLDVAAIGVWTTDRAVLVTCVVITGAFIGMNNTLVTSAVMTVAPVPRPVASAAYGFVRFFGAGLAPYAASTLAADLNIHVPFYLAAVSALVAVPVLLTARRLIDTPAPAAPGAGTVVVNCTSVHPDFETGR